MKQSGTAVESQNREIKVEGRIRGAGEAKGKWGDGNTDEREKGS